MKIRLLAAILLSSFLVSCATVRKGIETASDNSALITPTVALVTTVVFEKAVSAEDLADKATLVNKIADKILAAQFTAKPTQDEIEALIVANLPEKDHWKVLASYVASYYTKYTRNIADSDVEGSIAVLKAIAEGLKIAAAKY